MRKRKIRIKEDEDDDEEEEEKEGEVGEVLEKEERGKEDDVLG
jgi:hypothetical protein